MSASDICGLVLFGGPVIFLALWFVIGGLVDHFEISNEAKAYVADMRKKGWSWDDLLLHIHYSGAAPSTSPCEKEWARQSGRALPKNW